MPIFLIKYGKQIGILVLVILIGLIGYRQGVQSEKTSHQKTILKYKQEVIDLKNQQIEEMNRVLTHFSEVSIKYQEELKELKQVEKTTITQVIKEIEKPVYKQCLITQEAFDSHSQTVDKLNK